MVFVMVGRKSLNVDYIFKKPHYRNIIALINDANAEGKKIGFDHLSYALVKGGKKPENPEMKKFLDGYLDLMRKRVYDDGWLDEQNKISSNQNLNNFLYNLQLPDIDIIRKDDSKHYELTKKGLTEITRGLILMRIDNCISQLKNVKDSSIKNNNYSALNKTCNDLVIPSSLISQLR